MIILTLQQTKTQLAIGGEIIAKDGLDAHRI